MIVHMFPSMVYKSRLSPPKQIQNLNKQLKKEIEILSLDDRAGIEWSKKNYPYGYTSYASANQMHLVSPTFQKLQLEIEKGLPAFIDSIGIDIKVKNLKMSTCWVNIMNKGALHSMHTHPLSVISGTYYVSLPEQSSAIRFEDPRYLSFMARPALKKNAKSTQQSLISLECKEGDLILFESYMKHEVPRNISKEKRISISFNFDAC